MFNDFQTRAQRMRGLRRRNSLTMRIIRSLFQRQAQY